jgi:oxygen-independent coproporphyrinogen-3 oxidase
VKKYINEIFTGSYKRNISEVLTQNDLIEEYLILRLRMNKGINLDEFKNRFKVDLFELYPNVFDKYIKYGFIIKSNNNIYLSIKGMNIANTIFTEFIND